MRKIYLWFTSIILVLIAVNIYYYTNIYTQQVDFHRNILKKQTEICSWEIEQHISGFMNELNFILFTDNISRFFTNPEIKKVSTRKIESFFLKYKDLITSIALYDNQKNVFNILKDRNNNPVTDIYLSREQKELLGKENIEELNGESVFTLPYFADNKVAGNIVVRIDTRKYIKTVFDNYHINNTLFQWLINNDSDIVFTTFPSDYATVKDFEPLIQNNSGTDTGGSLKHTLVSNGKKLKVISTFYPIKVMHHDMMVIFSLNTSVIVSFILKSIITISAATFIVLVVLLVFFLIYIRKEREKYRQAKNSELDLKNIVDFIPLGIIIKDFDNKIRLINKTALEILKIDSAESVLGKDLSNMFFLSREYPDHLSGGEKGNAIEFVYFDNDEEEIVLYKKEKSLSLNKEEVIVEAFIDISPLEQSRRDEFILAESKSEFLKKVSHDIRNPLNAIINLTDSLEMEREPAETEKDKLELIRTCCEDIVLVVNDIMDFSKIEAGNILMEEIPFPLQNEIDITMSPLINAAAKKNIEIKTTIDKNVPEIIIGDPFQIRQVLTKLLSNSLKYTDEGKISLSITSKKQTSGAIILEFILEDTGIGMPAELLKKFNDVADTRGLLETGSHGLNKIRQLVNLLKGSISIKSPLYNKPGAGGPGTRIMLCLPVLSNDISGKTLKFDHIKNLSELRALVLSDSGKKKSKIQNTLKSLKIQCETTVFNFHTVDTIKSRLTGPGSPYSIIFIINSEDSNGFSIARQLKKNDLDKSFLVIIVSSVNKAGNFIKSKRFGADYYLKESDELSEISEIINTHFSNISLPAAKNVSWKESGHSLKILVAEDNPANQFVAQALFKRLGYEIDLACNGKDAVKKVREKAYDIIFMDILMPVKNGFDATYEIRKLGYDMPIVAMTGKASEADKSDAIKVGMTEFISKPVSLDLLKNSIKKNLPNHQG